MKILFVLKESIYDCKIEITDSKGSRYYYISALCDNETTTPSITAEVYDNEFHLTLIPVMPDTKSMLNEFEENNWKDKFTKKATNLLFSSLDKMVLRVGCSYHINNFLNFDRLEITFQSYVFGTFDWFDLLELIPAMYAFYEVSNYNSHYKLTNAFETNRKDVLKAAKKLAFADVLGNGFLLTLFTYPIQITRIKHLTKNQKILKTLVKFNNFSNVERKQFLDKQKKFFDR